MRVDQVLSQTRLLVCMCRVFLMFVRPLLADRRSVARGSWVSRAGGIRKTAMRKRQEAGPILGHAPKAEQLCPHIPCKDQALSFSSHRGHAWRRAGYPPRRGGHCWSRSGWDSRLAVEIYPPGGGTPERLRRGRTFQFLVRNPVDTGGQAGHGLLVSLLPARVGGLRLLPSLQTLPTSFVKQQGSCHGGSL